MDLNDVDLKFWISVFLVAGLSFSVLNDFSGERTCRPVENGSVCFNQWDILGYDTNLPIGFRVFGNVSMDGFELTRYVFERESDLVDSNKSWPDNSSLYEGGNWNGSVPDYNVSVVEGTLE